MKNVENLFKGKDNRTFHELAYYYVVAPKCDMIAEDFEREEIDKGVLKHHSFKWFTLDELRKSDFKPVKLLDYIENDKLENILYDQRDEVND